MTGVLFAVLIGEFGRYSWPATVAILFPASAGLFLGLALPAVEQACIELVTQRYRERTRIGEVSKALMSGETVSFSQVRAVVVQRCVMCHNEQVANKNMQLHTPALIAQHAQQVYQQAVVLKAMPLNNATQISDAERALIQRWFETGAPAD